MRSRRGMTLVELMSVVAIIATLAAILFPVFARAREAARKHSCLSNLVNIGLALQLYAQDHAGRFPPVDDDLSPLVGRYLRGAQVFGCPSTPRQDIPMGAPANRDLLPEPDAGMGQMGPPGMEPPGQMMPPPEQPERAPEEPIANSYYYRAGHGPGESPAAAIVTDHAPHHNDRANVLYSDGHTASPADQQWRDLGFEPIDEILFPQPDAMGPGGMGMPGSPPAGGG